MSTALDWITTQEAAARSGASFRQIDYWCRVRAIEPAVPATGSGSRRRWTEEDIVLLSVFARISDALPINGVGAPTDLLRRIGGDVRTAVQLGASFCEVPLSEFLTLRIAVPA